MDLKDFEDHIDEVILDRGLSYYEDGNVISLKNDDGTWSAVVEGTHDYKVKIKIAAGGKITRTECNCPYDMGRYCKHEAAVLYAIRDELLPDDVPNVPRETEPTENAPRPESLTDILERMDKKALVSILTEFADRYEGIKEEIIMRHSDNIDVLNSARDAIQNAISDVEYRGIIRYGDMQDATGGAETVLRTADEKIISGNIPLAVDLCIVVIEEMMDLMERCDDSDGYIGGVIGDAVEMIDKAVSDPAALKNSKEIFAAVFDHAFTEEHDDWEWRTDLLFALVPLCGTPENRDKIESFISEQEAANDGSWGCKYEVCRLEILRHDIIKRFDGDVAADSYLEQHMDNTDIRLIAIENALERGSYEKALSLCEEGEVSNDVYESLMKEYKNHRYKAYERTGDIQAQKILGMELLAGGNRDYYPKLKELYGKEEWPSALQKILRELETSGQKSIYVHILIEEGLKSRLLDHCRFYTYAIVPYHEHLLPEYKKEVCEIFLTHIRQSAIRAGGRDAYRGVCDIIRHYKEVCGAGAYAVRDELMSANTRRPAFMDELRKMRI